MPRNISNEVREAFFHKNSTQLDDCLKQGISSYRDHTLCRELVMDARLDLGYSEKTSAVDIYRPLIRGYKVWRLRQPGQ
jgi:hypothetical protein